MSTILLLPFAKKYIKSKEQGRTNYQ